MPGSGAECRYRMRHQRTDRVEHIDLAACIGTHVAVRRFGPFTQLTHVAEDEDGAPGETTENVDRRADGSRVGVVTVVDQAHAAAEHLRDAAPFDRLQVLQPIDDGLRCDTQRMRRGGGSQGIGDAMASQQVELDMCGAARAVQNEVGATADIEGNRLGMEIRQRALQTEADDALAGGTCSP